MDAHDRRTGRKCSTSTDRTANTAYAHIVTRQTQKCDRETEKQGRRKDGRGAGRDRREEEESRTREKHQEWRATEAIVFRGNLQNVSFHRGSYQPNWFVIPFHRRPARVGARRSIAYSREKVHLPCPDGTELSDLSFRPNGTRSRTRRLLCGYS